MTAKQCIEEEFPLNYYCAFEVFQKLGFDECVNLAEAFKGLQLIADQTYKRKFTKLRLDLDQPSRASRFLYHAGPTAKSLTVIMHEFGYKESILKGISETCKEVENLTLEGFDRKRFANNPIVHFATKPLKMLTLNQCCTDKDQYFFDAFTGLKYFNLFRCRNVALMSIRKCFINNQEIESFTSDSQFFVVPKLLELLPNLERLSVRFHKRLRELNWLSLSSLRHFTLTCWNENVNVILDDLAQMNILKELVLINIVVDEETFDQIKLLENLQLLVVTTKRGNFPASDDFPKKLKTLKLGGFNVYWGDMSSLVERLEDLTHICLQDCKLQTTPETSFDTMFGYIVEELIVHSYRQLNIAVYSFYYKPCEVN